MFHNRSSDTLLVSPFDGVNYLLVLDEAESRHGGNAIPLHQSRQLLGVHFYKSNLRILDAALVIP